MASPQSLIEGAFSRLAELRGYASRPDQRQLALLLSDLIDGKQSGAFEAPTGLGKSLAALIPAIAHAIAHGRRTVIATYTNVLAEQYWRNDLPLALSLFDTDGATPRTQMLMGRQRYACLAAVEEHASDLTDVLRERAVLGIESEFRELVGLPMRQIGPLWQKVATPPVCPGRLCPAYDDCFYFRARRGAERAEIVITNHSVVIQHALMARAIEDSGGLLGKFDFLILDEAHDFPQAAMNGLEFELSVPKLGALVAIAVRFELTLAPLAQRCGSTREWTAHCARFREEIEGCQRRLVAYGLSLGQPGILTASPGELMDHPQVRASKTSDDMAGAKELAVTVSDACEAFVKGVNRMMDDWREVEPDRTKNAAEATRTYGLYLREYGIGCFGLFSPSGVSVSYAGRNGTEPMLRQDVIGLAEPLRELIWDKTPHACLSATLTIDGTFDFFRRSTGVTPDFEEVLPSPFDFGSQAAVYLPPADSIPDPTVARREGNEERYYRRMAAELSKIIRACDGRTLALFHSRKEMDGVAAFLDLPPELPVYRQLRYGTATVGEQFVRDTHSSLFALRSFWTGFDAPGQTLSCVALVRVPFEVPVDPPQIARLAYLQQQGLDAFSEHTLPVAKMMMRQGAGRLIRRTTDKGIVAMLDPRLQSKRYGEEILANLPSDMRTFRDIDDAVGWIGLEPRDA